jgi:hypothetical protein
MGSHAILELQVGAWLEYVTEYGLSMVNVG